MRTPAGSVALALGPAAALIAGGLLSSVRDDLGTTNVALVLAFVVIVASIAGRGAGVATAVVAATSFNFFHTQPYRSLRIDDAKDVLTVSLLALLGIVVGETAHRRRRANVRARSYISGERALERVAALLVQQGDSDAVWNEVQSSLVELLELAECRFEPGESSSMPALPHSGSLTSTSLTWDRTGLRLPASGIAMAVTCHGHTYGHIVMVPRGNVGTSLETRQVAVGLGDQFAISLALRSADKP